MQSSESSVSRSDVALAILRIAVGIIFLIFGEYKVFGTQFTLHGGFEFWIRRFLDEGASYPAVVPLLRNIVLPHARPIAFLVAYGEFAIGLSLLLGVLVRVASCFGFAFMLALLLSSNFPGHGVQVWQFFGASLDHLILALCFLTFMVGSSDARFSLRLGRRVHSTNVPRRP